MRPNVLICVTALAALAACEAPPKEGAGNLADACQLKPCSCVEQEVGLFSSPDTKPPLWKQSGEAYCPEGYRLRRDDAEQ